MNALGSVLRALYLLFAVAAGGRSLVQWLADPGRAPLAYALSTIAFGCYVTGFVIVRRGAPGPRARRLLTRLAAIELTGVVGVGTLSVVVPALFPDSTIWSSYGMGYGFVPLLIPLLVLIWLRREPAGRDAGRVHERSGRLRQPARPAARG